MSILMRKEKQIKVAYLNTCEEFHGTNYDGDCYNTYLDL